MNCVDVRDRLTEHALGVLDQDEVWQIERHLEWCAGCRKESQELLEGAEAVGVSLSPAPPRPALEERVVHGVLTAAGRRPRAGRRTVRVLTAATLAAALLAFGAVGWGFAERRKALDTQAQVEQALTTKEGLANLVATFQTDLRTKGTVYQANLYPGLGRQPAGTAVVFAAPGNRGGFALVRVVTRLAPAAGPYSVVLSDRDGHTLRPGILELRPEERDLIMANTELAADLTRPSSIDLNHLTGLTVVDRAGM
ncbi:MAG: anti-sigma factor, partial [Actinomycetota bacterium]